MEVDVIYLVETIFWRTCRRQKPPLTLNRHRGSASVIFSHNVDRVKRFLSRDIFDLDLKRDDTKDCVMADFRQLALEYVLGDDEAKLTSIAKQAAKGMSMGKRL